MDVGLEFLSACRQGLMHVAGQPASLPAALFLAGLAGSLVHCVSMCGPFVLGQVLADAESGATGSYGEWRRLRGAALLPIVTSHLIAALWGSGVAHVQGVRCGLILIWGR